MATPKYHRISDFNESLQGLNQHTSFEAGFSLMEGHSLVLHGRALDSDGREILSSREGMSYLPGCEEAYRHWNPADELLEFMTTVNGKDTIETPVVFQTPLLELTLEVVGPVAYRRTFGVTIYMSGRFRLLEQYDWKDSASMCIKMLVDRESFRGFLRNLHGDLQELLAQRAV